jgi:hypothetical protein
MFWVASRSLSSAALWLAITRLYLREFGYRYNGPPTAADLLVDLAECLFQLGDQPVDTSPGFIVGDASRHLAIFHDLHFEFYALVF